MRNTLGFRQKNKGGQSGFTLLELMVVACIIAVLGAVLLNRVLFYQRMAEKTATEQTVGILQSALQLRFTSLIASNRLGEVEGLVKQNPMQWLAQKPANYAGEYFDQVPDGDVSGQWYFDLKERSLVYFVHNRAASKSADAVLPQLRFKTSLVLAVENYPVAERSVSGKIVEGVVLEQIIPYAWD
ncbi:type II secretion system protein [Herminiimonas arsenitoxidans]|uniref:type II secretion system protein n=1 Tax=Herminiimonas arsenitoxidans TaxID=1809410 RepID=UPI000970A715|nr:type II secretion system protein [Herminiimonas arsenitoxidans]